MAESQAFEQSLKKLEVQLAEFGKMYLQPISPEKCRATGNGLEVAKLGERATALLHVVDTHGKDYTDPVESLICELVSESTGEKIDCSVEKRGANGLYKISYQATSRGRHQLHIKVEEKHIIGSPFTVFVKRPLPKTPLKTTTGIDQPWGVAISSRGNIIVAETSGNCVSIFNPEREKIQTFGSLGSGPGQFSEPAGVAVDDKDNILVTDSGNNRIQKFTSDGKFLAAADNVGLHNPIGVAIHPHSKEVYVADTYKLNNSPGSVKILHPDLTYWSSFGGEDYYDRLYHFNDLIRPYDVAFDSTGKVYVAYYWKQRIRVFTAEGKYLRQFGSKGDGKGELHFPTGISIDREDVLYVAEKGNDCISLFKCDGQFLHSFGSHGSALGQFSTPRGVALDKDDNIYVSDCNNNRVQFF